MRQARVLKEVKGGTPVQQALIDAEFEVLRLLGVGVYRTATLDGRAPAWLPRQRVLLVGTDLRVEDAADAACEVLGIVSELLAESAS